VVFIIIIIIIIFFVNDIVDTLHHALCIFKHNKTKQAGFPLLRSELSVQIEAQNKMSVIIESMN